MGSQTPNYGFNKPDETDNMSDFETWLNSNWTKIENAVAPDSGTTLPTSGSYNIGDRFYKSDTKSIYVLVCKDANWGWYWRPLHDAISPWVTVPTTCLNISGWSLNPVASKPFQIALDNRGKCYWRGVIGPTTGNIPRNQSISVFKPVPNGIRPRERGIYILGHETLSVGTDGTNLNSYQGARLFLSEDPTHIPTIRCFGGTADFNKVYLDGSIHYAVGTQMYTAV